MAGSNISGGIIKLEGEQEKITHQSNGKWLTN